MQGTEAYIVTGEKEKVTAQRSKSRDEINDLYHRQSQKQSRTETE